MRFRVAFAKFGQSWAFQFYTAPCCSPVPSRWHRHINLFADLGQPPVGKSILTCQLYHRGRPNLFIKLIPMKSPFLHLSLRQLTF